ncbi:hypothetical protein Y032_0498g2542 [Ancylostoma ceylanicum]|nr:hypothetical protein Y032_0498g2542 [Ancylostoma ceylanicum]
METKKNRMWSISYFLHQFSRSLAHVIRFCTTECGPQFFLLASFKTHEQIASIPTRGEEFSDIQDEDTKY